MTIGTKTLVSVHKEQDAVTFKFDTAQRRAK